MIATFDWVGYAVPLETRYDQIKQAGFDAVSLWWGCEFGDDNFQDAPRLAKKAGLVVEHVHAPFKDVELLWQQDCRAGDKVTERYTDMMNECAFYGIKTVVMHLSERGELPISEVGLNRVRRIVEAAEQADVRIAFENLKDNSYLHYVLDNITSCHAGLCYDSGHDHAAKDGRDLIATYGSRLFAVHLHDNDGTADMHLPPFDGSVDWATVMAKIKDSTYSGAVSLEAFNIGYENLTVDIFLSKLAQKAEQLAFILNS